LVPVAAGLLSVPAVHVTSMLVSWERAVVATALMVAAVASTLGGHVVDVMVGFPESLFSVTALVEEHTALPSQFLAIA